MGVMSQRAGEAIRQGDTKRAKHLVKVEANFITDHLLNWLGAFSHDIERFSQTKLYQGLGHLALGFVETDREFLAELENGW